LDPAFINKEKITSLLPMQECIPVMEEMFSSLARGNCMQPLRSIFWLPGKKGLLGMMPGYDRYHEVMGIKVISVFHANRHEGHPSHQGVVILFDARQGRPLMMFDAQEITAIRTAAASAVATKILSREDSETLAIIGSGEQAERHIESISLVRKIKQVNIWGRNEKNARHLMEKISTRYSFNIFVKEDARSAVVNADIICTVTSSTQPLITGEWVKVGAHINAVGSSMPNARELDSNVILKSKLFTDCYESIFHEAGDFLIPKNEGIVDDSHVKAELGEVIVGKKKGRENSDEITIFKSLGIAAEDIFSCWHIYQKIENG
jgi:ornithine cyclodeaminase